MLGPEGSPGAGQRGLDGGNRLVRQVGQFGGEPTLLVLGGYAGELDDEMSNVGVIPVLPTPETATVLVDWRRGDGPLLVHAVEENGEVLPLITEVMADAS